MDNTADRVIKQVMSESRLTQVRIAEQYGCTQHNVSGRIKFLPTVLDFLLSVLDMAGYELVVQPKKRGRRPDGQIVIERGGMEE